MESSSSDALLGDFRVCGTGCGLADEKSRAADVQARAASSKKLFMAIVLCGIFIAVELAGGLVANSLAILTDAAHLLSDVAVLVIATTIRILRDTMEVLMESTPREIDAKKLEKGLCAIPGVVAIHELHIWAITMGKTLLACHVTIMADADADDILQKVMGYCDRVFSISHVTIQIERRRGDMPLDQSNF